MTGKEIQPLLAEKYGAFLTEIMRMPEVQAHMAAPGKWSPAQQAEHLVKSVRPVALAFALPKFILPALFGKANRPSRTFDDLVARYQEKLAAGGRASRPFIPGVPTNLRGLCSRLEQMIDRLNRRVERFSESELDTLILPHPLLGKLTLREMLYFTAYHAEHHRKSVASTHLARN